MIIAVSKEQNITFLKSEKLKYFNIELYIFKKIPIITNNNPCINIYDELSENSTTKKLTKRSEIVIKKKSAIITSSLEEFSEYKISNIFFIINL
jgi:hypothetical protein